MALAKFLLFCRYYLSMCVRILVWMDFALAISASQKFIAMIIVTKLMKIVDVLPDYLPSAARLGFTIVDVSPVSFSKSRYRITWTSNSQVILRRCCTRDVYSPFRWTTQTCLMQLTFCTFLDISVSQVFRKPATYSETVNRSWKCSYLQCKSTLVRIQGYLTVSCASEFPGF